MFGYNFQGDAEQNCKQMDELKILTLMHCQKFQHVSKVEPQFWIFMGNTFIYPQLTDHPYLSSFI